MRTSFISSKDIWEDFLLAVSPQALFQSWNWGEIEKRLGRKVWRVGVYKNAQGSRLKVQGELLGISQIVKVEAKRGCFLHVRHGPVFRESSKEIVKGWLKWVRELAREERAVFIRVSPLIKAQQAGPLQELGFCEAPIHHSVDALIAWVLDLRKSEEELLQGMRKTTRYLIRKGKKMGIEVAKSINIIKFLELYQETYKKHGFIPHQGIKEEYKIFQRDNQTDLFLAKHQDKILAAALILYYGEQAIYHHGASKKTAIPVSYFLQWEAIKEAKKRGMRYYNFWGIAETQRKTHPWWGLTLFKKGFGGGKREYLHAQDLPLSPWYYLTFLLEKIRKWRKGY